ncbi:MAG: penicillin-binding protein activator, partial [Rheinheimera sp.]|nr:penicillin-binding protein activator [Rheinheimera sp.]
MTSSKLKPVLFLCFASLVAGCASGPVSVPQQEVKPSSKVTEAKPQLSARELYRLAANYQAEPQQHHLLKAASQALQEQDYLLALAITESLKQSPYPAITQRNLLLRLKAYLATNQQHSLTQLLEQTDISAVAKQDQAEFLWLSSQFHS